MHEGYYVFQLPDDPIARARLVQKFWSKVAVNTRPGNKCWWWRPKTTLFQCKVARIKYATHCGRAAWVIIHGESLGPDERVVHACGNADCVSPRHLRRHDTAALTRDVRRLERQGLSRAAIARQLDVSWSFVDRNGTGRVVDGRSATPRRKVA